MYVIYILVVVIGRYVNQRMKFRELGAAAIRKNDFSSDSTRRQSLTGAAPPIAQPVNAIEDEFGAEEEYESEQVARPLLTKSHVEELPEVGFSKSDALVNTFVPVDGDDWRKSNILFKFMILVKVYIARHNQDSVCIYYNPPPPKKRHR